ncbi:MAG: hypothetical protein U9R68_11420 [Planctomycetota bacterium]|nr:hypothetical protein [Planctomycetota bacterium]
MRPMSGVRWFLALAVMGLVSVAAVRPARAEAAEAQEPAASESAPGPDAEERYAKGETLYDGEWMPVQKLFEKYCQQRDRLRSIERHGSANQGQLDELHREMAQIRGEERKEEQPIRLELGKARHKLREYNNILRQKPPAKPQLQRLPPPPTQPTRRRSSSRNSSSGWNNSRDDWYDRARRAWQQRCDAIKRQNETKTEQYRRKMEEYQKKQNEAKQEVPKLQAQAKEAMRKIDELEKQYKNKAAPTRQRSDNVTEMVRAHNRRVDVIEHDVKAMAKALSAVPEAVLHKHGIVEFEGEFHTAEILRQRYEQTQREIDRVREKLQAECKEMNLPFPEDWRHPQQGRMDKIKALVEKVKKARAASG